MSDKQPGQRITSQQFEALQCVPTGSERVGSGPMAQTVRDTYQTKDGRVVVHEWGMGGETFRLFGAATDSEL